MLAGVITKLDNTPKELMSYLTLSRWGTEGLAFIQDSFDAYHVESEIFTKKDNGDWVSMEITRPVVKSIYYPSAEINDKTAISYKDEETKAYLPLPKDITTNNNSKIAVLDALGFYRNSQLEKLTHIDVNDKDSLPSGIWVSLLAIGIINVLTFVMLIIVLKQK
ncbi:MAG: hypothetical protein HC880_06970 [Bacteroidia bacterium]|nr:hypothetical protein [Bacteroidia bacterium]